MNLYQLTRAEEKYDDKLPQAQAQDRNDSLSAGSAVRDEDDLNQVKNEFEDDIFNLSTRRGEVDTIGIPVGHSIENAAAAAVLVGQPDEESPRQPQEARGEQPAIQSQRERQHFKQC